MKTVVIIGGGMGGMSAAHELIERGFEVTVLERQAIPGGKARSVTKPGTGTDGRADLPGEHGFRFFPRFYHHITDTMQRTPVGGGETAFHRLVEASRDMIARKGKRPFVMPAWFPRSIRDVELLLHDWTQEHELGLTDEDLRIFAERVWQLMTTCPERALQEYERMSWTQYLGAKHRSKAFQELLAYGLTRTLVAATPSNASTQVGGEVLTELIYATARPGTSDDRLLNGPTNDVWINPWLEYLKNMGVDYRLEAEVTGIRFADGRVTGVTVRERGIDTEVVGDYYIAAVPVERFNRLLTDEMIDADPTLAGVRTLAGDVEWMTGIQFYLSEQVPIVNGHVTYIDSPWALTSISQQQFWAPEYTLSHYGNGRVRDILSVDISDWNAEGILHCHGEGKDRRCKTAKECTREQIKDEVWAQLKESVNVEGREVLRDDMIVDWYLDRDIVRTREELHNREPLLVNRAGRWVLRPDAHTGIPNLFLASDYVRTNTNLATMEAANEAARRAVNSLIDACGLDLPYCKVWKLYQPWILSPLKWHDRRRFDAGLPWDRRPPSLFRLAHAGWTVVARVINWFRRRG